MLLAVLEIIGQSTCEYSLQYHDDCLIYSCVLCFRRGDLPFTVRRTVPRAGIESDEESEPKSEAPEPKPE